MTLKSYIRNKVLGDCKAESSIFNIPHKADLVSILIDELRSKAELGVTGREMEKKFPKYHAVQWMHALAFLHEQKKVTTSFTPLKQPSSAIQESRYFWWRVT